MEMKTFCDKVKVAIMSEMGEDMQVRISEVHKNNGILLHGISVFEPGVNITPTVYLEEFLKRYEDGETFANIVRDVKRMLEQNKLDHSFEISAFTDLQKAKRQIVYKLVNTGRNHEMLEEVPHISHLDMAVVFYYLLNEKQADGYATILIRNSHLKHWGITAEELYSYAIANTRKLLPPWIENMEEMMRQILSGEVEGGHKKKNPWDPEWSEKLSVDDLLEQVIEEGRQVPMYVLTNHSRYYGAACILYPGLLKRIGGQLGCNYYVLPSSVHEVILLPDHGYEDSRMLLDMVREVNETEVKEEEVLSDSVYYYDCEKEELSILRCEAFAMK